MFFLFHTFPVHVDFFIIIFSRLTGSFAASEMNMDCVLLLFKLPT